MARRPAPTPRPATTSRVSCPVHDTPLGRHLPPCPKCGRAITMAADHETFAFRIRHRDGAEQVLTLTRPQAHDIATQLLGSDGLGLNFHLWGGYLGGDDLGASLRKRILEQLAIELDSARYVADAAERDTRYAQGKIHGLEDARRIVREA